MPNAVPSPALSPASSASALEHDIALQVQQRTAELRALLGRQEAVFEEQKSALARDLHADLGASLTALNMQLAILFRQMPDEVRLHERASAIKTLTTAIALSTRRMQASLRPDKLDSFGLKAAIEDQASEFANFSGIQCVASLPDEDLAYPPQLDINLFRMLQTALDNVSRHAQATRVDIVLDDNDEEIMLSVRDNGIGMPPGDPAAAMGHGLRALRERAVFLNGELAVSSQAGKGTSVVVRLRKPVLPG